MKIAIGGISTETNSFNQFNISREEFHEYFGSDIIKLCSKQDSIISGIISQCQYYNIEIIPLYYARAMPSGPIQGIDYIEMRNEICTRFSNALNYHHIDAICLGMHGSMYVADADYNAQFDDPEADLLVHLHDIAPNVPIHLGMDMHATISDILLQHSASITLFKTAPHIDMIETGKKCVQIAFDSFASQRSTMVCAIRIPLILSGEISMTTNEPMHSLINELYFAECKDSVLSASYALGFPWADSPHLSTICLVTSYSDGFSIAQKICADLANKFWEKRTLFNFGMLAVSEDSALTFIAESIDNRPIIVSDVGDNATAGASENCVNFLKKILDSPLDRILFAVIFDLNSYEIVSKCSINEKTDIILGKFFNTETGININVKVRHFFKYLGKRAAIVNYDNRIDIIVAQQRIPVADTTIFQAADIAYNDYRAIVIKCGYHGADLCEVASLNILALSTGNTDPVLERLQYNRVPRPIYPLNKDMVWLAPTF